MRWRGQTYCRKRGLQTWKAGQGGVFYNLTIKGESNTGYGNSKGEKGVEKVEVKQKTKSLPRLGLLRQDLPGRQKGKKWWVGSVADLQMEGGWPE